MQDNDSHNAIDSVPSFIVTRYTHGAAGKFLSSVLQTSDKIDHWSTVVQGLKHQQPFFSEVVLQYISRSFPKDHSQYLRFEPMVPYNTDLYSTGYPRGNDVEVSQYIYNAVEKNDLRLIDCLQKQLKINLIFNKPYIPNFCTGSDVVTVTVCSEKEKKWLYKTVWSKHFLEVNGVIKYLPSDPDYCNFASLIPVLTYGNVYQFPASDKALLYEKYVVNNALNQWYFEPDKFFDHDKEKHLNNFFVSLECILNEKFFLESISKIFKHFELGKPNLQLIAEMHNIWLSRQICY